MDQRNVELVRWAKPQGSDSHKRSAADVTPQKATTRGKDHPDELGGYAITAFHSREILDQQLREPSFFASADDDAGQ